MALELQMTWQLGLVNRKRRDDGPIGLRNLGNSCFINSVLQCLTHTPPLANLCLTRHHSSLCDSGPAGAAAAEGRRECPFCVIERRLVRSLATDNSVDAPSEIRKCLGIFSDRFRSGREEDAHEFLHYVLVACHSACLRLKEGANGWSSCSTVVREIFGGALQSQVKCLSCGGESNTVEEFMDISLEVLNCDSLREALRAFFNPEVLDGSNMYDCENCKKLVKAQRQMSIYDAPNILVIQLKRFELNGGKIDKCIAFEEFIALSSFMCKTVQDPRPEYKLYATIVHSGLSLGSGHYYAYIKDAMGQWYCCNDSTIIVSTLQQVLSEKVYILFFTRVTPTPVAGSEASISLKDITASSKVEKARSSSNGNGNDNVQSNISGSKRKSPESCILLAEDTRSRAEVDELKQVLEKKAHSVLQSCGWSGEVYRSMHPRKRLCTSEAGRTQLKKLLISEAKSDCNSKIPKTLKADLIGVIQPFIQGNQKI